MISIPAHLNGKTLKSMYPYHDLEGNVLGVVGRYHDEHEVKDVIPFFKQLESSWKPGIELAPRPLFGLDKLAHHKTNKAVFVVEGEKAASALHSLRICAVTSIGGAKAASKSDWSVLQKYSSIYLLPDNDKPGEEYIRDVFKLLSEAKAEQDIKIIRLPELNDGGDVVDWLQKLCPGWDGFSEFPGNYVEIARKLLYKETQKAMTIPADWFAAVCTIQSAHFDWEKPNEIKAKIPDVQNLRSDMIPSSLRAWITDVSNRMQTPSDFVASTALICISSLIGAGCGIRPKKHDTWEVVPNLWGACIGRPSVLLKSPSMAEPINCINRLQKKYQSVYESDAVDFKFESMMNKSKIDDIKTKLAKKAKSKDQSDDDLSLDQLKAEYKALAENEEEPTRRLFKTNEASIQSMTLLQKQNPRGILFFRDEITGLLSRWDQEEYADERAYFLEAWNGNGSYTDIKISRGITDAESLCVSVAGGIQPNKLQKYFSKTMQGNNDGLIQRFQLAVWPDEPQIWKLVDERPDDAAKMQVYRIFETLADMDFTQCGAEQHEHDSRPFFRFDDEAQDIFYSWLTELQTTKIEHEENPFMAEHLGKFRSLMPSLALIFHCIEIANRKLTGKVTATSATLAVDWCKYLESHARRIYSIVQNPADQAAENLAKKIKNGQLTNPFTVKMVYDKGWNGLCSREEVEAACEILIDENWLIKTRQPRASTGRPPLPIYHINPAIHPRQGN